MAPEIGERGGNFTPFTPSGRAIDHVVHLLIKLVLDLCPLTEALALVGGSVDEHLGGDDVSERQEHLHQLGVPKLLRQVVDEEVAALRSAYAASWRREATLTEGGEPG